MARRSSGSVGRGGGALSGWFFPPSRFEAQVLEIGKCDARHERVSVQTGPGPAFEAVKTEFLLELLMSLFAYPARLDCRRQTPERGADRKIAEIVFLLSAAAPFSDQPDFLTRQMAMTWATRSIGQPHAHRREARGEWALDTLPPGDNVQDRQSTYSAGRAAIQPAPALHAKTGSATPGIGSSPACPERRSIVPLLPRRRYLSSAARCRRSPAPHHRRRPGDPPAQPVPATAVHHPRPGC